jgi:hypothetical protein
VGHEVAALCQVVQGSRLPVRSVREAVICEVTVQPLLVATACTRGLAACMLAFECGSLSARISCGSLTSAAALPLIAISRYLTTCA